jgi:hypothetical protein
LEAVGAIMRKDGFSGIRTNRVARLAGKDKNLIRYHFQGIVNLQRAYIREKDYWPPFFERFTLSDDPSPLELEMLFSALMQENLRYFKGDMEMQQIILWQISERNPLLRSISDAREKEGAVLLDRTDEVFRHTGVDFRSVVALLLGGAYYIVLHANGNGSVVCGIDIAQQRDYQVLLKTIGQVVEWAFRHAVPAGPIGDHASKAVVNGAVEGFAELERLVLVLHRNAGQGQEDKLLGESFAKEIARLKILLLWEYSNFSDCKAAARFMKVSVYRLTRLADRLSIPSGELDSYAGELVDLLIDLVGPVWEPVISELTLPRLLVSIKSTEFGKLILELENLMLAAGLDIALIEVVLFPFKSFGGSGTATWHSLHYLEGYAVSLKSMSFGGRFTECMLIELMVSLNMNDARLAIFYDGFLKKMMDGLGVQDCLNLVQGELKRIGIFPEHDENGAFARGAPAKSQLVGLLELELLGLQREVDDKTIQPKKIQTDLNVQELSLWQKLQLDQGIYLSENLDDFVQGVASGFAAKGRDDLSPGSIKSKLYARDPRVLDSLEQRLLDMLTQVRQMKG